MTKAKTKTIKFRTAPVRRSRKDNIDLERVVWDPEYRRAVCDRLNRKPASETRPETLRAS